MFPKLHEKVATFGGPNYHAPKLFMPDFMPSFCGSPPTPGILALGIRERRTHYAINQKHRKNPTRPKTTKRYPTNGNGFGMTSSEPSAVPVPAGTFSHSEYPQNLHSQSSRADLRSPAGRTSLVRAIASRCLHAGHRHNVILNSVVVSQRKG